MLKLSDSGRWPVHPQPLEDEALSSWMVRLAHGNGFKTQTFYAHWLGRSQPLWNRDIDRQAPHSLLNQMARWTGFSMEKMQRLCLKSFDGYVYEDCVRGGFCDWLLPLGIHHRTRRRGGMQFCPECLAMDAEPYLRRTWRMAWATVCTRHSRLLADRCPECSSPVQPHRVDMQQRSGLGKGLTIATCCTCGLDLRTISARNQASLPVVELQQAMQLAATNGYLSFAGSRDLHSLAFFMGVRIIATGLLRANRKGITAQSEGYVEHLGPAERHILMSLVASNLADWPERFAETCSSIRTPYSHFTRDAKRLPYWLDRFCTEQLRRDKVRLPPEEVQFIQNMTEAATGKFSTANARRLYQRDLSTKVRPAPVTDEDAEEFLAFMDQAISTARGSERRDLLRDKVLFLAARISRLTASATASLTSDSAEAAPSESEEQPWKTPSTTQEFQLWMPWYMKEVRSSYRAANTKWLFLCSGKTGKLSESLISARFVKALQASGLDRRIHGFKHWAHA